MNLVRMVDVRHDCIRTFEAVNPTEIKFIALSYVWGGSQTLQLFKSNTRELGSASSLTKASLPQTIADAIDVARELGVDFIWVDALCIVQDDHNDLREQISSVALIYRSASFTIIAACGNDCNTGLAGLRSGTRKFEQKEVVVIPPGGQHPGMSLVSTCKSYRHPLTMFSRGEEDIDLSVWNTRGWTLQERVLSRRNLVFTKEQAMWVCDGAFFCEESYFEHPSLEHDSHIRTIDETALRWTLFKKSASAASFQSIDGAVLATSQQRFWEKYKTLVTWFTERSFTYPGDAFDGFRGITDALERLSGEKFLWGHPRSRFGLSLFWEPTFSVVPGVPGVPRRRTELTTLPMTNLDTNVTFPSWSWLGWTSRVNCSVGDDRRDRWVIS
jgi:Heterokaryon incompatibility protein (HET)